MRAQHAGQALLSRLPMVQRYRAASESDGGWGATWVQLRPAQESQK